MRIELLWLVGENANGDIGALLQLDGENLSSIGWNAIPGTPGSFGRSTVQAGRSALEPWA